MKKILLSVLVTFFLLFTFVFPHQATAQVSADAVQAFRNANIRILDQRATPRDFTLPLLDGGNATLSSYRGEVVILNFWATWCPPCREEMPSMENLYQRFKDDGLEILAVDIGESAGTVRQFVQNFGYTFPILMDTNNRVASIYGIQAIPTSLILDREGRIIARIVGSIYWDTPRMIDAFDALLKSR